MLDPSGFNLLMHFDCKRGGFSSLFKLEVFCTKILYYVLQESMLTLVGPKILALGQPLDASTGRGILK